MRRLRTPRSSRRLLRCNQRDGRTLAQSVLFGNEALRLSGVVSAQK